MFPYDMGGTIFGWWLFGSLLSIGFLVLVVWLIALVVRSVFRDDRYRGGYRGGPGPQSAGDEALSILRQRFARGEITVEEYEQAKRILGL